MDKIYTAESMASELEKQVAVLAPEWVSRQPDLRARLAGALAENPEQLLTSMNYVEFLAWANEDIHAEWVDGKVFLMTPASRRHQQLALFLSNMLNLAATKFGLGQVLTAPFQMKLSQLKRGREPDILFIAAEHLERLTDQYLDGPADLVVEIVSPESTGRDRGEKFIEYEAAGVPEYWLIDPQREEAEFYVLDGRGRYRLAVLDAESRFESSVMPGVWVRVDWLWQDPLPSVVEVARQLGVV